MVMRKRICCFRSLMRSAFMSARGWSRIVELVGLARAANTADRRAALFDSEEAAVRGATHVATVRSTPRIGIVRHFIGWNGRRGENGGCREGGKGQNRQTHGQVSLCFWIRNKPRERVFSSPPHAV